MLAQFFADVSRSLRQLADFPFKLVACRQGMVFDLIALRRLETLALFHVGKEKVILSHS